MNMDFPSLLVWLGELGTFLLCAAGLFKLMLKPLQTSIDGVEKRLGDKIDTAD